MAPLPFAFSVHHFINSVGADAGFAAIIGLAILVLLYFAQARETSSLREALADAAQRVQQMEARIAQLSRQARHAAGAPLPPRQGPPRVHPRPGAPEAGPRRPAPLGPPRPSASGPSRLRQVLIVVLALLAVAGAVVLLLVLTSNNGGSSSSS